MDSELNTLWGRFYGSDLRETPKKISANPVLDRFMIIGTSRDSSNSYELPTLVYLDYSGEVKFIR